MVTEKVYFQLITIFIIISVMSLMINCYNIVEIKKITVENQAMLKDTMNDVKEIPKS